MENNKLFVYGILKRGYELDLAKQGAKFLGEAEIPNATLYGIGHRFYTERNKQYYSGVGLRLDEGPNGVALGAKGELWEIPDHLWKWLDQIEQNGFCYTRKIVSVIVPTRKNWTNGFIGYDMEYPQVDAWTYEHTYPGFNYDNPIESGTF